MVSGLGAELEALHVERAKLLSHLALIEAQIKAVRNAIAKEADAKVAVDM
jgi:hypothetical protein